jgi:hypothetical protein
MKQLALLAVVMFFSAASFAQIQDPVKWNFSSKKIDASTYEVRMTASLEDGWHIYSQTTPDGGPIATSITYTKNPLLTIQGSTKEVGKLEQRHEPLFGVDVKQFSDKVEFVQVVKLKAKAKTTINGVIEFMSCNDHECLPPSSQKFSIELN